MREGKEEDGMADHICNHTFYRSIYIMPTETKKKKSKKNEKKKTHPPLLTLAEGEAGLRFLGEIMGI